MSLEVCLVSCKLSWKNEATVSNKGEVFEASMTKPQTILVRAYCKTKLAGAMDQRVFKVWINYRGACLKVMAKIVHALKTLPLNCQIV